jgi:hypothetical protein
MKQINKSKMKRVFTTMLLGVLLFSCTPSESTPPANTTDCNCGVVVQSVSYNIPDNNGGVLTFSNFIVRNNCTQLTKNVYNVSGVITTGSQWCN